MDPQYSRFQDIWIYRGKWRFLFWASAGGISWQNGEFWWDLQTECRSSDHCDRYTGSDTTGKTAVWDSGRRSDSRGSVRTGLSAAEEASQLWIFENDLSFTSENEHIPGRISSTFHDRICDPPVLPGERICLCTHSSDYRKWLRRGRRNVPGYHHGFKWYSEDRRRKSRFLSGFLPQTYQPHGKRSVKRGNLCTGFPQHLYFRTDFPCRKLQYYTPCGRVLDDWAGNGFCRFRR